MLPLAGGNFPFTVQVIDAKNISASQTYSLHVTGPGAAQLHLDVVNQGTGAATVSGNGVNCGVTSSPKGINCGKRCSASFTVGTSVTLTAKPDKKHSFLGWTGACGSSGTSLTCSVPMLGDKSVGARLWLAAAGARRCRWPARGGDLHECGHAQHAKDPLHAARSVSLGAGGVP